MWPSRADTDVVIAGAGPAGTHLAIRLARLGFSVALLDQKRFPRRKPCGEFMSPECLPMLGELGLAGELEALGARRVRGMDLHGYGTVARGTYGPIGRAKAPFDFGYAIRRELLDASALRVAAATGGITVHEGTRVADVLRLACGTVAGVRARGPDGEERELRARFTIGADGLRSRIAGRLGLRRDTPWLKKLALVLRWHGRFPEDHSSVHLFPGGYFAVSAVGPETRTVNLVVDADAGPSGKRALPEFVAACLERAPRLRDELAGATRDEQILAIGPLAGTTTRQAFAGGALVGDSCGYVDPLTGEGLYFAMRGAALLAGHLAAALHAGRTDARALAGYQRERRNELGARLWVARMLQRGLRYPAITRGFLRLVAARPGLCDLLVAFAGDYVPARELLRPAVWFRAFTAEARPHARGA
jgi:flavin-dependent dehydrogenase